MERAPLTPEEFGHIRAFREETRRINVMGLRVATTLGFTFVPLFGVLDYIVAPEAYRLLWLFRALATVCSLGIFALTFTAWGRRHVGPLSTLSVLLVAASIAMMVRLLGGHASPYYAGLGLLILAAGFLYTWALLQSFLTYFAVLAMYLLPSLLLDRPFNVPIFISNSFFLCTTAMIIIIGQVFNHRLKRKAFISARQVMQGKKELEAAHEQLKELDRLKSEFFSNITHELRTPLTMILSPLESMLEDETGQLTPDQRGFLVPVRRNALKLLKLINDLLDLAKIEERHLRLQVTRTDLVDRLREIVEVTRPLAARKEIDLSLQVRGTADDLHLDLEKLERALINLLSNALKFTEPGGRVTLFMETAGRDVLVGVRDTGVGIPTQLQEGIFRRFSQADGSVARRFGGTGIGLSLAREIVAMHGGQITVQSEVGKGSLFLVRLPRGQGHLDRHLLDRRKAPGGEAAGTPERQLRRLDDRVPLEWTQQQLGQREYRFLDVDEATGQQVLHRGGAPEGGAKVLVVEDNLEVLNFLDLQLRGSHAVYLARDGVEGLEQARRELPDVIVSDYMMPRMDGLTMLRELRADPETAEIPLVMLTARGRLEERIEARHAGADVYLRKPFSVRELREAVARLLQRQGRQVKAMVRESVRSLEVISAGLAHELHNPLSYIKNAHVVISERLEAIQRALQDGELAPEERDRLVGRGLERVERMREISATGIHRIEQVIQLVRSYAREGYPSEPSPLLLDEAVRELERLVSPRGGKEVRLELELGAPGAAVLCIPEELKQALRNLWQNALDAVEPGGRVSLRTRRAAAGELVELEVSDDGPGITSERIRKIFTPFYTTKAPHKGMGLGLAIAQKVIQQCAGTLAVESRPGEGATFKIQLPLAVDEPAEQGRGSGAG